MRTLIKSTSLSEVSDRIFEGTCANGKCPLFVKEQGSSDTYKYTEFISRTYKSELGPILISAKH
jgi:hypothetical protein